MHAFATLPAARLATVPAGDAQASAFRVQQGFNMSQVLRCSHWPCLQL